MIQAPAYPYIGRTAQHKVDILEKPLGLWGTYLAALYQQHSHRVPSRRLTIQSETYRLVSPSEMQLIRYELDPEPDGPVLIGKTIRPEENIG